MRTMMITMDETIFAGIMTKLSKLEQAVHASAMDCRPISASSLDTVKEIRDEMLASATKKTGGCQCGGNCACEG